VILSSRSERTGGGTNSAGFPELRFSKAQLLRLTVPSYLSLFALEIYSDMARNISNVYGKGTRLVVTPTYTEQNFTPLSFNWMGKELQLGSLFVLKFSLLSDSIGIYDSKYPKANNNVENSVMIGICG
jgi:hypothetical protein